VRTAGSLVLVAGLVAALAACSPSTPATVDVGDCDVTPTGAAAESVKLTGEFGTKPGVTFASPLSIDTTSRVVAIAGDGDIAQAGDTVQADYLIFNAGTGELVGGTEFAEGTAQGLPLDESLITGIVKTLQCSAVGSRVVGALSSGDAWGADGSAQLGIAPDTAIVIVADVVGLAEPPLARADGEDQPVVEGMPTVVLDDSGAPTITIPATAPPAELELAVLKKGDGAVVGESANVVVHYTGINWNTGVVFDSSWDRGAPTTFNTRQVIAGFTAALEGQTVGSQVLVVIPPDQGYGAAGSPPNIGGTDTIVFVVDILGIG
jgi:peptidylprolyl isomerase